MIKSIWASEPHQRTYLKQNDSELATALESGNNNQIEKVIGERLKKVHEYDKLLEGEKKEGNLF